MPELPSVSAHDPFTFRVRPLPVRLWRHYRLWRRYLPPFAAARAAWQVATGRVR